MDKIFRAGIVPYYIENSEVYMLFMKPSDPKYGGEYFQIAKGKIEEGESTLDAALREGFEELGLLSDNIEQITDIGQFLGRTNIFLAKVIDRNNFTNFHFETSETRWMTFSEYKEFGRNLHLPIIKNIIKNYVTVSKE